MKCDVKKVTNNMYSCDTCCMSREMMEIDGRDNVKCRKIQEKGHERHYVNSLNDNRTKLSIVSSPSSKRKEKTCREKQKLTVSLCFLF